MNIYYRVWIDCILTIKAQSKGNRDWKLSVLMIMSLPMALNFMMFMIIVQENIINSWFYTLNIEIFPFKALNGIARFFILFFLPMFSINYFLIFSRERYELFIAKYIANNGVLYKGKLFTRVFFMMMALPIAILVLGIFIAKS